MEVTLGSYAVDVATGFGPRITGLRHHQGTPLFASLPPELGLEHDDGFYRFHGGHRLWAAPEIAPVTYAPDDHECVVTSEGDSVLISAPPDRPGLVKEIEVTAEGDELVVEHRLSAASGSSIAVAPWAITQVPLGGMAILSLAGTSTAPLPDRQIVLWPYTDLDDPRIRLQGGAVVVAAEAASELKIGTGPTAGRIGYLREGWLFVKTLEGAGGGEVPDFGAVHQVYVGDDFCELENMGGIETVSTEATARLIERWRALQCPDLESAIRHVTDLPS